MTAAAMAAGGCSAPLSTLDPAGPVASSLAQLWWVMFWGAAVLFTLVMALLALVMFRQGWGKRISPRAWIISGGLVLPALVLPPLVGYSLLQGERILPRPGAEVPRIKVEAFRWGWRFRYPDHGGGETQDVLHLPAGEPVDMLITGRDVIHSFWVPQLAGKLDAIPGHVNVLRIVADAPGRLQGQCAEFCGTGHADMRFEVIVHPSADFTAALAEIAAR